MRFRVIYVTLTCSIFSNISKDQGFPRINDSGKPDFQTKAMSVYRRIRKTCMLH